MAIAATVVSRGSALGGAGGGGGIRARRARWLRPKILPPRTLAAQLLGILVEKNVAVACHSAMQVHDEFLDV